MCILPKSTNLDYGVSLLKEEIFSPIDGVGVRLKSFQNYWSDTPKTLRGWDARGLIDTIRSPIRRRLYDVRKYREKTEEKTNGGHRVIYVRVSSTKQRDDLKRQVAALLAEFPQLQVVRDIGSGINWSRPGLRTVLR